MRYELHYSWANGFYERTRRFKVRKNAVDKYYQLTHMLTNTCSLSEITPDGQGKLLLSKSRGDMQRAQHPELV